jgi:type I restriction enzyme R subunit
VGRRAVADGVNVDGHVYRIHTQITEQGSHVEAGFCVDKRNRQTRRVRWEQLNEDLVYDANQLDREVVSESQIRAVIRAFRDKLFTEIFPGRTEVPNRLVPSPCQAGREITANRVATALRPHG